MGASNVGLLDATAPDLEATLQAMVEIHIACSEVDGTIATFLPPWNRQKMVQWYKKVVAEVKQGNRAIVLQYLEDSTGSTRLAGFVMLAMPQTETGPFRGSVEKLLVSPDFRKRGVARALLAKLEEIAAERGRTLLMLDTEEDSPAEKVYPRLGFIECGRIPSYGISPVDRRLIGGVFFYKFLEGHSTGPAHLQA